MAPVHPLDIYNDYNCDKTSRMTNAIQQHDNLNVSNGSDGCFDVIQKLIAAKTAQDDHHPFFVMHTERISGILENWFKKMPNVMPFYSMRCNSNHVLLKLLTQNADIGLCCSNRPELEMAMKFVDKDRIVYRNPLWTRANIRHAKEFGTKVVIIESEDDLKRFATYFPDVNIILRVVMDRKLTNEPITMDNVNVEEAVKLLCMANDLSVKITGISLSLRTDTTSPTIYSYAVAQCRRLFDVAFEMGHKMNILDLGDGFPSNAATSGLSFDQIAGSLHAALSLFFPSKLFAHVKIIAEPGAFFAASVFSLLTRIVDKRLIDASLLTNDKSDADTIGYVYQINEGFYGAFGCKLLTHRNPTCSTLSMFGEKMNTYAAIVGPESCDTDVILSLTILPSLQVGDWLIWHEMGAYTMDNCETLSGNGLPPLDIHYYYEGAEIMTSLLELALPLSGSPSCTSTGSENSPSVVARGGNSESEPTSHSDAVGIVAEQLQDAAA